MCFWSTDHILFVLEGRFCLVKVGPDCVLGWKEDQKSGPKTSSPQFLQTLKVKPSLNKFTFSWHQSPQALGCVLCSQVFFWIIHCVGARVGLVFSPERFSVFLCLLTVSSLPQKTDENLIKCFQNMKSFVAQNWRSLVDVEQSWWKVKSLGQGGKKELKPTAETWPVPTRSC